MLGFLTAVPRPVPVPVVVPPGLSTPPADYAALASSLGVDIPVLPRRTLAQHAEAATLASMGVSTFDLGSVDRYLRSLAKKASRKRNLRWVWKPLRKADVAYELRVGYNVLVGIDGELDNTSVYEHLVPGRVLEQVRDISGRIPGAKFYVSDYAAVDPDPFMMFITEAALHPWVFAVWDEPGFTG